MVNSFLSKLKAADKPIYLYGTGNAAEKIINYLDENNITIAGIFASDAFVRDRSFCGHKIISYSDAKAKDENMIVLLAFGSHLENVIENIKKIACEQELYAPDLAIAGSDNFVFDEDRFVHLNNILADAKSREVLDCVIKYKLSGDIRYLLKCETNDDENWQLLNLSSDEEYLDLGAYTGDTVLQFIRLAKGYYKHIYAVEPEARNFRKLNENCSKYKNTNLFNCAIGNSVGIAEFTKGVGRGGALNKGKTYEVNLDTVDNLLQNKTISFIKMDLEGQEQNALIGAENTIKTNKPKMLISAYHRQDDLLMIPELILKYNPDYKIYLRKSPCLPAWEINYYVK